ncbi:MAG: hypothetical protein PHV74_15405 [Dehalococcoidia bacterium]|nr:hypothetical protein [Dehalococcoidia bacterium]
MKEISRTKKVEVARCYLLGCTYGEMEQYTGVSHGSIANIVRELETGKLDIPGTPSDQVNDLRQLSLDLKKKGLSASQAVLGLSLFEKAHELDIVPEHFKRWAQLISKFNPPDFPTAGFLGAAIRLYQLEEAEGKTFETVIEEYRKGKEDIEKLKMDTTSLHKKKAKLSKEVASTSAHVYKLGKGKAKLETEVGVLTDSAKGLQSRIDKSRLARTALDKEIQELQQKKTTLSAQVDGKQASVVRLNTIGLYDEDLLRLRAIIERMALEAGTGENEVKQRFFTALGTFKSITELQECQAAEMVKLEDLTSKISLLTGQIMELEKQRDILRNEITESAASTIQQIADTGQKAVTQLQQQADNMKGELDGLFAEAMRVAGVIGEMKAMVEKGEDSENTLSSLIEEVTGRVGRN